MNAIVEALEQAAARIGRTLSTDAKNAVEKMYRDVGKGTAEVAKRVAETDAKHAQNLVNIAEKLGKNEGKTALTDAEKDAEKNLKRGFDNVLNPKRDIKYRNPDGSAIPTKDLTHPAGYLLDRSKLDAIKDDDPALLDIRAHKGLDPDHPRVQAITAGWDKYGGKSEAEWKAKYEGDPVYDKSGNFVHNELRWPDSNLHPEGFLSPEARNPVVLHPGERFDRFGGTTGNFLADPDASYASRALPAHNLAPGAYHEYEVVKPIPAWEGKAAEAMGQAGGATQQYLPYSVEKLILAGYLKEVTR
jgi:hypothetical protein